jgi:hypothetical protein
MLLEYSYDNANKILAMFNEGKLATLNVHPVVVSKQESKFVMEYTLITEYPSEQQVKIKKAMSNPNSYPVRMRVTEQLNQFIEASAVDAIINFTLSFTAIEGLVCRSSSQCQFGNAITNTTDKQIKDCVDKLDALITKMGVGSVKLEVYRKEGSGKNKRNVPLTLSEVTDVIRQTLMEG